MEAGKGEHQLRNGLRPRPAGARAPRAPARPPPPPHLSIVALERSYHVATLDYDADLIFTSSSGFFQRLAGKEAERVASG